MAKSAIGTSAIEVILGDQKMMLDLNGSIASEARYRGLLEAAPDAMVVVNQDGGIVLLNVQAEKQFGYQRDELLGQKITRIIPEGFAERLIADGIRTPTDALAQQIGMGIELSGRRKDGSRFPIEIMLSPLESAEGILVTAAIRNITTRKDSEARYRGLLEAAPDAMVVVNQDGGIVLLNVQAEKQFGYQRDELLGQKITRIIPEGFAERLIADGIRTPTDALAQQIGMGIELSGRRKDGSRFPIEIMLSPLESAEGILVTAAIRNITTRKDSEARYRGLLEAAPDAMVVVNQDGGIVLLNVQAEKQFGYQRDELLGQKITRIIPEGFAERLIADGIRTPTDALAQQIGMGIELSGRRKDGSRFPIEIMLSPLESAEGILVTAAIRNISARTKSERDKANLRDQATALQAAHSELELRVNERTRELAASNQILERSNIELQQFAYIASHDLQSPLRSISGFVQLLKIKYESKLDEQAGDWIRRAVQAIGQMQALIQDLLAYSRVDSRLRPFMPTSFLDVFNDTVGLLESSISEAGGQVTCGELPVIMGDRSQLVQLMDNLIGNGLKYHGDKAPHVHVSAERNGNKWNFSVSDNGIGIAPEYYERIFEIFQRLHDKKDYPGTGIGLAVCRRIVGGHGGTVWVESEPGQGSTFHFTIPAGAEKT